MRHLIDTDEWKKRAIKIHGKEYDYSKSAYVKAVEKILIICKKHGPFFQAARKHTNGQGCPICRYIKASNTQRMPTEKYIKKAKKVNKNKYCYNKIKFKRLTDFIKIKCSKHGWFSIRADRHLKGKGCQKCSRLAASSKITSTLIKFKNKASKAHHNKYDYSKVFYKNAHTKVEIICKKHGSFIQNPNNHLRHNGCPLCANEQRGKNRKGTPLSSKEFIEKSRKKHGKRYSYLHVKYVDYDTPVKIICKEHGLFLQTPNCHLYGSNCQKCALGKNSKTMKYFIKLFSKIHNNKYSYKLNSLSKKYRHKDTIKIVCKKHGEFKQGLAVHLKGSGCPLCNASKGEERVAMYLVRHKIKFEKQKSFKECINPKTKNKLRYDFYVKKFNLLIEYDGPQHFKNYPGLTRTTLKDIRNRDQIKTKFAKINSIKLLRIRYGRFSHIEDVLSKQFAILRIKK